MSSAVQPTFQDRAGRTWSLSSEVSKADSDGNTRLNLSYQTNEPAAYGACDYAKACLKTAGYAAAASVLCLATTCLAPANACLRGIQNNVDDLGDLESFPRVESKSRVFAAKQGCIRVCDWNKSFYRRCMPCTLDPRKPLTQSFEYIIYDDSANGTSSWKTGSLHQPLLDDARSDEL